MCNITAQVQHIQTEVLHHLEHIEGHSLEWYVSVQEQTVIALRLRSGHIPCNAFAFMMRKATSPNCPDCNTKDDLYHRLMECVRNKRLRSQMRIKTYELSYEAISKIDRDGQNIQSPLSVSHSDAGINILSPSVPYKKRNNIKIEHTNNDKLTNTYELAQEPIVKINQVMETSRPEDVKIESAPDLTTMSVLKPTIYICMNPPNTFQNDIEPTYDSGQMFHEVPVQNNVQVWVDINESATNVENRQWPNKKEEKQWPNDRQEEKQWSNEREEEKQWTNKREEEKQWPNKSSFLDPANWKRTMLSEEEAIEKFHKRAVDPKYMNARYKCMECYSNFAREEMLKKHILINHVEAIGPHVCRFCKRRFQKACKLRLHMKRHYVQIQCLRCNMVFWGEGLAFQHEEFHRGVLTTCQFCNHQFRHKSTYYQHLRTHHRSSHVCALCGASFVSKAGLNVHKKRLHAHDNKETCKEPDANIYCKRCDMKFATLAAYQEHYRHSALHADGMDIPITEDARGTNVAARNPYVRCTVCNEQFFTYQACMKHHRHHHPTVPFMKKSITYSGKSNERVSCDLCGAFIKVTSLYTHMNAHTRAKVYTCEICEMQFNYPTSLLRHKVTHTGEKKYPCPLCEKRFTQRNSMQLHYRTFHLKEPYPKRNRSKKKAPAAPQEPLVI